MSELLRKVESGDTIAITRYGKTIAHCGTGYSAGPYAKGKMPSSSSGVVRLKERRLKPPWKRCFNGVTRDTAFDTDRVLNANV